MHSFSPERMCLVRRRNDNGETKTWASYALADADRARSGRAMDGAWACAGAGAGAGILSPDEQPCSFSRARASRLLFALAHRPAVPIRPVPQARRRRPDSITRIRRASASLPAIHLASSIRRRWRGGTLSTSQTPLSERYKTEPSACIAAASTENTTGGPCRRPTSIAVATSGDRWTWCRPTLRNPSRKAGSAAFLLVP